MTETCSKWFNSLLSHNKQNLQDRKQTFYPDERRTNEKVAALLIKILCTIRPPTILALKWANTSFFT